MRKRPLSILLATVVTVASVSVPAGAAFASSGSVKSSVSVERADQDETQLQYSTRDVIAFFVLQTGPLFDSHTELVERLQMTKHDVPNRVIGSVVQDFYKVDPNFDKAVTSAVQSGNPARAQRGLERLASDLEAIAESKISPVSVGANTAQGWTYTTNYVSTVQVALAGAYVAVLAAALAGAVFVLLYEPNSKATEFERELVALSVAQSL